MSDSMNTSETVANEELGGPPSDFDGDLARDMMAMRYNPAIVALVTALRRCRHRFSSRR